MRIGVTISRDWDDYDAIQSALRDATWNAWDVDVTVVHGASQMDWFVAGVAHTMGFALEAHPADWRGPHGRGAGMVRNIEMVRSGADIWLAFIKGHSRGASHCASAAELAGIPVRRYER